MEGGRSRFRMGEAPRRWTASNSPSQRGRERCVPGLICGRLLTEMSGVEARKEIWRGGAHKPTSHCRGCTHIGASIVVDVA